MTLKTKELISATATGSIQRANRARKYDLVWRLVYEQGSDHSPARVIADFQAETDLPWFGDFYEFNGGIDTGAFVESIQPRSVRKREWEYLVTVSYSTPDRDEGGTDRQWRDINGDLTDDPSKARPTLIASFTEVSQEIEQATLRGGFVGQAAAKWPVGTKIKPINSAGQVYVPGLEETVGRRLLRFERYQTEVDFDALENNVVNSVAFSIDYLGFSMTVPVLAAKVNNWSVAMHRENEIDYWRLACDMHVKGPNEAQSTWRREVYDRGTAARASAGDPDGRGGIISPSELVDGLPEVRTLTDGNGNPLRQPVLLDGDGQPLQHGLDPVLLTYEHLHEGDISALPFFALFLAPEAP